MAEAAWDGLDPRLEAALQPVLDCGWSDEEPSLAQLEVQEAATWGLGSPAPAVDRGRMLLDVREAARLLACSRSLLYELIAADEVRVTKIGRLTRFTVAALEELIARRSDVAASKAARGARAAYPASGRPGRRGRRRGGDR
jgi:excisionase family DNA binding protein